MLTSLRTSNAPDGVFVDSPGGRFEFFSRFAPAIERRRITTLSGDVRSAAVILTLLGERRYAHPDATFFFHEIRALTMNGDITITELGEVRERYDQMNASRCKEFEEWDIQMRAAQSWFLNFMATKTQLPTNVFLDLMRNEATLSAREAVRYGIVHRVLSERQLEQIEYV